MVQPQRLTFSLRTEIQYDTSEDDADETGNGGDGNDRDGNGGGSDANGDSSYEVVVTNEDVVNGTEYDVYEDFNVTQVRLGRLRLCEPLC